MALDRAVSNTIANLTGAVIIGASAFGFNLAYFHMVGAEQYGLVSVFTMLTTMMGLLDLGMSRSTLRELARRSANSALSSSSASVLMTLQIIQWGVFAVFGGAIFFAADSLSTSWLRPSSLDLGVVRTSIELIGITAAVTQPKNLYLAGLNGLGRQWLSNGIQSIGTVGRGLVTIFMLAKYDTGVLTFFWTQLIFSLLETTISAGALWSIIPAGSFRPRLAIVREVRGFAGADGANLVVQLILTLGDKIVLSRILPLDQYGQYGLVTVICSTLSRVATPFGTAYFPEFILLWESGRWEEIPRTFARAIDGVCVLVVSGGLWLAVFSTEIITLLTSSPQVANDMSLPMKLYALGTMIACLQYVPHTMYLSFGCAGIPLKIFSGSAFVFLSGVYALTPKYGLVVPPALWFVVNFIQLPIFLSGMSRAAPRRLAIGAFWRQLCTSAIMVGTVLCGVQIAFSDTQMSKVGLVVELIGAGALGLVAATAASSTSREWLKHAAQIFIGSKARGRLN